MILSPMARDFIQHFGEMGSRWGINRISAQVFALLYLSPHPTDAGAICAALNFSRSHVGAALKDLEQWRLVSGRRSPGDRRDHFVAVDDVWEIARVLAEERRRRELEPTREMLRKTAAMRPRTAEERHQQKKNQGDARHFASFRRMARRCSDNGNATTNSPPQTRFQSRIPIRPHNIQKR